MGGVGRCVNSYANRSKIIIEKSTVPVKTAEALERVLEANKGANNYWILSNPEFLAEGTAMNDLDAPDRVLIGGRPEREGQAAAKVLAVEVSGECHARAACQQHQRHLLTLRKNGC